MSAAVLHRDALEGHTPTIEKAGDANKTPQYVLKVAGVYPSGKLEAIT
jgi:hypothetical protein